MELNIDRILTCEHRSIHAPFIRTVTTRPKHPFTFYTSTDHIIVDPDSYDDHPSMQLDLVKMEEITCQNEGLHMLKPPRKSKGQKGQARTQVHSCHHQ